LLAIIQVRDDEGEAPSRRANFGDNHLDIVDEIDMDSETGWR